MTRKAVYFALITSTLLAGCSSNPYSHFGNPSLEQVLLEHADKVQSLPDDAEQVSPAGNKTITSSDIQHLERMYSEWRTLKPQLERFIAQNEQAKSAQPIRAKEETSTNLVTPQSKQTPTAHSASTPDKTTKAKSTSTVATKKGNDAIKPSYSVPAKYTLQIGASKTQKGAMAFWQAQKRKHMTTLGFFEPNIESAIKSGKPIYRVKVGAFPAYKKAHKFCEAYKQLGGQCLIRKINKIKQ